VQIHLVTMTTDKTFIQSWWIFQRMKTLSFFLIIWFLYKLFECAEIFLILTHPNITYLSQGTQRWAIKFVQIMVKFIAALDEIRHFRFYRQLDFAIKAIFELQVYENIICMCFQPILYLNNFEYLWAILMNFINFIINCQYLSLLGRKSAAKKVSYFESKQIGWWIPSYLGKLRLVPIK